MDPIGPAAAQMAVYASRSVTVRSSGDYHLVVADHQLLGLVLDFARPGLRVLDLGLGTGDFSLALTELNCNVMAIDGSPDKCAALEGAAERRGLTSLHVINAIPGDITGPADATAGVASITIDDLIQAVAWPSVDIIKMSLEGSELAALGGMSGLLAKAMPVIVLELNGPKISQAGHSTRELLAVLWVRGYRLMLIEDDKVKNLTTVDSDYVQADPLVNYLAVASDKEIPKQWKKSPVLDKDEIVGRLLTTCADPLGDIRRFGALSIAEGPEWLKGAPEIVAAVRALSFDLDPEVQGPVRLLAMDLESQGKGNNQRDRV